MRTVTFDYNLQIEFSEPVRNHRFTVCCFPISDNRQEIIEMNAQIEPNEFLVEGTDHFGNKYIYGNAENSHTLFGVMVTGKAKLGLCEYTDAGDEHRLGVYKAPSKYTHMGPELKKVYDLMNLADAYSNIEKSRIIMQTVNSLIEYCPGATEVNTSAEEALKGRKGVCQDYSHIMLALCRKAGIPCRYVVGMLIGEGASHAWVEIYDNMRWYGMDPTNLTEVNDSHVKISHGRDYDDCQINRGVFVGCASQTQTVSVRVEEPEA